MEVKVTPYKLITMWPNPANSEITISFDIANSSSAYIVITNINNNVSNNYILNTSTSQKTINLTNYSSGQYSVTLIVNGQIIDSKNLIKN